MAVYERAAKAVPDDQKMGMYELYIARAAELFGVAKTREIYEVRGKGEEVLWGGG